MHPPGSVRVAAPEEFARVAAAAIRAELEWALRGRGPVSLCLAGGSTPRPVYEVLATAAQIPWERVRIYFGDERCVGPEDPASNYRVARETLLDRVSIPAAHAFRVRGEHDDPAAAAADYAALLPRRLDVLILGIGADGHTASLFPGSPALRERRLPVVPVSAPKPPSCRITITPPVIERARRLVVLAAGEAKTGAVARALEGELDIEACPAQLARRGCWIIDADAAAGLHGRWERDAGETRGAS